MLRLQLEASDVLDAALKLLAAKLDALPEPFERAYSPEGAQAFQAGFHTVVHCEIPITSTQMYSAPEELNAILEEPASDLALLFQSLAADARREHPGMALTLLTADMPPPPKCILTAQQNYSGIAGRLVSTYDIQVDAYLTRLDVLFSFSLG
jgi:hypothetical protein